MENTEINPEVCFFDSGIGGLNLLHMCVRKMPRVNFTYFADNSRVPYGTLSHDTLLEYVTQVFDEIEKLNPDAVVVACNTVTAECIDNLRERYKFNIIGIQPAVKPAAAYGGKCVVLATPATANSKSLHRLIENYGKGNVKVVACPELAAYIEDNIFNLSEDKVASLLPEISADTVVLGCTHYIFVNEIIKKHFKCAVFDGIEGTCDHLCGILGKNDHNLPRAQKIAFSGGFEQKNRQVFNALLKGLGNNSP